MSNPNAALLTVADKTGLKEFGDGLHELGWKIFAGTDGTNAALTPNLSKGSYKDILLADPDYRKMAFGHNCEAMAGFVASMILEWNRPGALEDCVPDIGMLCINLATTNPENPESQDERPHIDWGGPALISAGIKRNLFVVTKPDHYDYVLDTLAEADTQKTQQVKQALNACAAELFQTYWNGLMGPLGEFPAQ